MTPGILVESNPVSVTVEPAAEVTELTKTLPAETFRSTKYFELERRAIFSQKWLLVSHTLRFSKPGDYISEEYAGFPYFIILNKNGEYKVGPRRALGPPVLEQCRLSIIPVATEDFLLSKSQKVPVAAFWLVATIAGAMI
jgi:hypothetical protein